VVASSNRSGVDSPTSAFVPDPGEPFDPKEAGAAPEPTAAPELDAGLPAIAWDEPVVRGILEAQGSAAHALFAVDKGTDEWRYTQADLGAITPPLTRILNRYDALRAAAGTGDEIALVIGLSGYAARSYQVRRASIARLRPAEPEPASGRRAEPGSGRPPAQAPPAGAGLFETTGPPPAPGDVPAAGTPGPEAVEPSITDEEEEAPQWRT
jgi:hypothetical protein